MTFLILRFLIYEMRILSYLSVCIYKAQIGYHTETVKCYASLRHPESLLFIHNELLLLPNYNRPRLEGSLGGSSLEFSTFKRDTCSLRLYFCCFQFKRQDMRWMTKSVLLKETRMWGDASNFHCSQISRGFKNNSSDNIFILIR